MVSKIRYKDFLWEHNPKTLKVTTEQQLCQKIIPNGNAVVQDIGAKSRVVTGTGMLCGSDCLEQYNDLLELQSKKGSGILSLPNTKPFYAFFKSIELACEPTPDLVTYNFQFIEDLSKSKTEDLCVYHSAVYNETLWDIAYDYGVDIHTLVLLNPQIKRIDEIQLREQVRVC